MKTYLEQQPALKSFQKGRSVNEQTRKAELEVKKRAKSFYASVFAGV